MRNIDLRQLQDDIKKGLLDSAVAVQTPDGVVHVHEDQAADYIIKNIESVYRALVLALKPFKPNVCLDISKEPPVIVIEGFSVKAAMLEGIKAQAGEDQAGEATAGEEALAETPDKAEGEAVSGQEVAGVEAVHTQTLEEERAEKLAKKERRRLDYEAAVAARDAEGKAPIA